MKSLVDNVHSVAEDAQAKRPEGFRALTAEDEELQAYADQLKVTATPTTYVLTKYGATKIEGALPAEQIDKLLVDAVNANR